MPSDPENHFWPIWNEPHKPEPIIVCARHKPIATDKEIRFSWRAKPYLNRSEQLREFGITLAGVILPSQFACICPQNRLDYTMGDGHRLLE